MRDENKDPMSLTSDGWRFAGDPVKGPFGLHGSVWLVFPWMMLSGWLTYMVPGLMFWAMMVFVLYIAYLMVARRQNLGPVEYLGYFRLRYLQRSRWAAYDE